jgi:hypothetical protein
MVPKNDNEYDFELCKNEHGHIKERLDTNDKQHDKLEAEDGKLHGRITALLVMLLLTAVGALGGMIGILISMLKVGVAK